MRKQASKPNKPERIVQETLRGKVTGWVEVSNKGTSEIAIPKKHAHLTPIPKEEQEIIELANELVSWSLLPTSFEIERFPLSRRMSPYRFFRIESEYMQDAIVFSRYAIAARLQECWRNEDNGIDKGYAEKMLALYSPEYRAFVQEKIKAIQAAVESRGQQAITVVMQETPNSSIVPFKKESE